MHNFKPGFNVIQPFIFMTADGLNKLDLLSLPSLCRLVQYLRVWQDLTKVEHFVVPHFLSRLLDILVNITQGKPSSLLCTTVCDEEKVWITLKVPSKF